MMHAQNVNIAFCDKTMPGDQPLNFKIPRTCVPSLVMGGKERDILVLTKLRPFDSWGTYEYKVYVQQPKSREMQPRTNLNLAKVGIATSNNDQSSTGGASGNNQTMGPVMQDSNMDAGVGAGVGVGVGNDMGDIYSDLMDAEIANQKQCGICTFLNSSFLSQCEMCGSNL